MQPDFTSQLLIKHLYNETTPEEKAMIDEALSGDHLLQHEFNQLQEAREALDEAGGEDPCAMSIHKILEYSSQQQMETV